MDFRKIAALVKGQKVIFDFQKEKTGYILRIISPHAAFIIPVDTDKLPDPLAGIALPDGKGELPALFKRHMDIVRPYSLCDSGMTYRIGPPTRTLAILEGYQAGHEKPRLFLLDKRFYDLISGRSILSVAPVEPGALEFVCNDGVAFFMPYKLEKNQAENLRDRAKTITEYYRYYGRGL